MTRHRMLIAGTLAVVLLLPTTSVGQDAVRVQPRSYHVAFENDEVRVLQYEAVPGMGVCGSGRHYHPRHLTILQTPARVRITEGGKTFVATNKAGDVFYAPAGWHEAENISGQNVRSLIVEFKRPPAQ
jgi:hypothetical protein